MENVCCNQICNQGRECPLRQAAYFRQSLLAVIRERENVVGVFPGRDLDSMNEAELLKYRDSMYDEYMFMCNEISEAKTDRE